jgi:hypothetical protein
MPVAAISAVASSRSARSDVRCAREAEGQGQSGGADERAGHDGADLDR